MSMQNTTDYDIWKKESEKAIKTKMEVNISLRAPILQQTINQSITQAIIQYKDKHWTSVSSIQPFIFPQTLIKSSIESMFTHVSEWKGVDIGALTKKPKNWREYHRTADNWWNRYKSNWIGDYFIFPLLSKILPQYIINITQQHYPTNNQQQLQLIRDKLFFYVLHQIMYAEITFKRTRTQPLILDQSFTRSKLLKAFLIELGNAHGEQWNIHRFQNRLAVRNAAREWVQKILQKLSPIIDENKNDEKLDENENTLQRLRFDGVIPHDYNPGLPRNFVMVSPPNNTLIVPPNIPNRHMSSLPSPFMQYSCSAPQTAYSPVHSPTFVIRSASYSPQYPGSKTQIRNVNDYNYASHSGNQTQMSNFCCNDTDSFFDNTEMRNDNDTYIQDEIEDFTDLNIDEINVNESIIDID